MITFLIALKKGVIREFLDRIHKLLVDQGLCCLFSICVRGKDLDARMDNVVINEKNVVSTLPEGLSQTVIKH